LVRPLVRALHAYVPGEQPKIPGLIKLNTNENPYPPAPGVLRAVKAAVDGRLRLYPNPTAEPLRERLAAWHGCGAENIIVGNGSDELLALATRAFVEPRGLRSGGQGRTAGRGEAKSTVQFFTPSYSLYQVLADIHGARQAVVPLGADFGLPELPDLQRGRRQGRGAWDPGAALTYITTPNAPSGRGYSAGEIDRFCAVLRGVVVLDEAYVDFAEGNTMELASRHPHVLVARTFSKAYSLCYQRVGYMVGRPELIAALQKVKDSYSVNGLGQVAALATLDNLPYYRARFAQIVTTRERVRRDLGLLGFDVLPSQTNFILTRPPRFPAEEWLGRLRERRILVRWFGAPAVREYLRITVGTAEEMSMLVKTAREILKAQSRHSRSQS
jgi:histidinol-phosphate aminotransferase